MMAMVYIAFNGKICRDEVSGSLATLPVRHASPGRAQVYDCLEICAGAGAVTRCLRFAGIKTASLDIDFYDQLPREPRSKRNPLDLLEPSGMACLGKTFMFIPAVVAACGCLH